ncbi:MAG: sigma-54 dependent transcriptional regulator [Pseudomonadota bacterium]
MDKESPLIEFTALNLVGRSTAFTKVLDIVKRIAGYDVSVAIYGETGTGKELVARAVHYLSPRADGPFIPVNCGSLPDTLFENEMFGHARGAFTDARIAQAGLIDHADGGTLFLDEIEALSLKSQAALLRFLQDKQYRPLGSKSLKIANVRIVTASNVAASLLREQGLFREDLYYRLNVMPLTLPPLRERVGDVELLAAHFMQSLRNRYAQPEKQLSPAISQWITAHSWPGNVRELENTLHRAFLLSVDDTIEYEHLYFDEPGAGKLPQADTALNELPFNEAKTIAINEFEKNYLRVLIQQVKGNVTRAAERAHKERRSLGKLLKKHQIYYQA